MYSKVKIAIKSADISFMVLQIAFKNRFQHFRCKHSKEIRKTLGKWSLSLYLYTVPTPTVVSPLTTKCYNIVSIVVGTGTRMIS